MLPVQTSSTTMIRIALIKNHAMQNHHDIYHSHISTFDACSLYYISTLFFLIVQMIIIIRNDKQLLLLSFTTLSLIDYYVL